MSFLEKKKIIFPSASVPSINNDQSLIPSAVWEAFQILEYDFKFISSSTLSEGWNVNNASVGYISYKQLDSSDMYSSLLH